MLENNAKQYVQKLVTYKLIQPGKESNGWYMTACPIHAEGKEKHPSFGILMHEEVRDGRKYEAGFCHCFACGYAKELDSLVRDIQSHYTLDELQTQAAVEILEDINQSKDSQTELQSKAKNIKAEREKKKVIANLMAKYFEPPKYVSEEELKRYRYTVPYMYERKLTDEVIAKYDVGYDPAFVMKTGQKPVECITFPVRDKNHNTLFLCRRSIKGKMYNYPVNVTKPVYGIDMIDHSKPYLLICESCINCLTAESWGYNAVALLGTGNPYQYNQLIQAHFTHYILCFDGDDAGHKATRRAKKALKKFGMVWVIHMPDGKDVNDCTKEEFDELFEERDNKLDPIQTY